MELTEHGICQLVQAIILEQVIKSFRTVSLFSYIYLLILVANGFMFV